MGTKKEHNKNSDAYYGAKNRAAGKPLTFVLEKAEKKQRVRRSQKIWNDANREERCEMTQGTNSAIKLIIAHVTIIFHLQVTILFVYNQISLNYNLICKVKTKTWKSAKKAAYIVQE